MTQVRSPATDVETHSAVSEIGPNAVIQLIHALDAARR
ncbi:bacteriochlorophyll 4-vinyl reductase, partial [Rhodopseudomonas palustris]